MSRRLLPLAGIATATGAFSALFGVGGGTLIALAARAGAVSLPRVTTLGVQTEQRDGLVRIALEGELDLSTTPQLEEELRRVEEGEPGLIVLDLSDLRFLDSTGLRLVVTADARARDAGRRLALVRGPETVHRVFTITRLHERLELVDELSQLRP